MSFIIDRHINLSDAEETQTQELSETTLQIGRGTGNALHLDDLRVSLEHASIEQVGETYILTDLDSANGTYVNRQTIHEHRLDDDDEIQIGPYTLHVHLGAPTTPVTLVVTHTALPSLSDEEAEPSYLAKYALTSSRATKKRLTVLGVVLVLGSVLSVLSLGRMSSGKALFRVLSPGNVSDVHRLFENDCVQCHQDAWQRVDDRACTTCHNQPAHHVAQRFTPRCATCHQEHRSRQEDLTVMADAFCIQCHANLSTTRSDLLTVADRVHSFADDHPEFAITVQTEVSSPPTRVRLDATPQDLTPIKLNHALHLKPGKLGAQGFEQLTCDNCHQVDAQGATMRPITYDKHCAQCHSLEFDPRFPRQTVPHATPETIHTFLVNTFTQYVLNHLDACETRVQKPIRHRPGQPPTAEEARSIQTCVGGEIQAVEHYLFEDKTCKECHRLTRPAGGQLPVVVPPAIPTRWLPGSIFNHQAHARAGRTCEDCHAGVRRSQHTSDVLLPGIATCQTCHTATGGARAACVTCHPYHTQSGADALTSGSPGESLPRHATVTP